MSQMCVLASGNRGKLKELGKLFEPAGLSLSLQGDYGLTSAEETGQTFVENAILKARHICAQTGRWALADDSGLVVDALAGEPGIYSARYAGDNASDQDNVNKLLAALAAQNDNQRTARFVCCLVLMRYPKDPQPMICEGQWYGRIAKSVSGDKGFGYDPVFIPCEYDKTAAQLSVSEKNAISHRAIAAKKMVQLLQQLDANQ